ncbi:glycosyltransferase family 39 protein [Aquihabitans sp. G128]|uniref:glycosyltransferase family 39 protein n=1 Tax=Aquihabitans sp. G128 TaxID=2849779 RepID=UPI001C216873|nr:glycosyltransferase family 39 protein [Aquihabitans sp. G128]QXC60091.1 glycosyltransferase family 39 protein [Aquihabitans sp. G128]
MTEAAASPASARTAAEGEADAGEDAAGEPAQPTRFGRADLGWIALALAIAAGAWLPRAGRRPFWLDESLTVGATGELLQTWRHTGGTMALYYLVVAPLAAVTNDRVALRAPSMLFAALAVVVVFAIGRRLGDRIGGARAATFLASSWFLARYAMEARSYALALLLVSVAWLGLVAAATEVDDERRRRWWTVYVVAMALAPLAHGLAALQFPFQVLALALLPEPRRWVRRLLPLVAILAVEGVVLFGIGAGDVANWIPPLRYLDLKLFCRVMFGRAWIGWLVGPLVVLATGLAVRDRVRRRTTATWLGIIPVLWAWGVPLLILAISLVRPYQAHRYILTSLPGVALLLAGLLARVRARALAGVAWAVLVGALLFNQPAATTTGLEEWPAMATQIRTDARPGELLLAPDLLRAPLDFAFEEQGPAPVVRPLSPTDPVGRPRRLYHFASGTERSQLLGAPAVGVWLVDRGPSARARIDALLADPAIAARYREVGRWEYELNLFLVHLEPVPA